MKNLDYTRAKSVKEALALLKKGKGEYRPMAGGTDLIVQWKTGARKLSGVIDIKGIPDFCGIKHKAGAVVIGPCTTLSEIASSPLLGRRLPLLGEVALHMASPQIRNRGTVGGNLANAAPSADMALPLIALDAKVQIISSKGRKTHPLSSFFLGPGSTLLKPDSLLGAITIPLTKRGTKAAYHPLTLREAMDISIASACVVIRKQQKKVVHARIVLGSVAPIPLRALKAEAAIKGTLGKLEDIISAARAASKEARPITDQRGGKNYRREMVEVLVERALTEVLS